MLAQLTFLLSTEITSFESRRTKNFPTETTSSEVLPPRIPPSESLSFKTSSPETPRSEIPPDEISSKKATAGKRPRKKAFSSIDLPSGPDADTACCVSKGTSPLGRVCPHDGTRPSAGESSTTCCGSKGTCLPGRVCPHEGASPLRGETGPAASAVALSALSHLLSSSTSFCRDRSTAEAIFSIWAAMPSGRRGVSPAQSVKAETSGVSGAGQSFPDEPYMK